MLRAVRTLFCGVPPPSHCVQFTIPRKRTIVRRRFALHCCVVGSVSCSLSIKLVIGRTVASAEWRLTGSVASSERHLCPNQGSYFLVVTVIPVSDRSPRRPVCLLTGSRRPCVEPGVTESSRHVDADLIHIHGRCGRDHGTSGLTEAR